MQAHNSQGKEHLLPIASVKAMMREKGTDTNIDIEIYIYKYERESK